MKRLGFLGAMITACLFFTVAGIAGTATGSGQPECDCCAKGRQAASPAASAKATEGIASCKYCGMDREKFAHSRMSLEYEDGATVGTCSIHCMAVELVNNIDNTPKSIRVGDYNAKKLIDAETAFWVIGGDKSGVMSSRAKWAFEKKADAEAFIAANKGQLGSFDDAIRAAYEDMYKDIKMIRERRNMKRLKQMEHN